MSYPSDVKESIMKILYSPNAPALRSLARDFGVPKSTIQVWMKTAGMMSSREVNGANKDKYWNPQVKLNAVIKSMTLSEQEFGEFLRQNGLYASLVTQWKEKVLESLVNLNTSKKDSDEKVVDVTKSAKYKNLQLELQRKDRALAEITSLLVLKKKADLLWADEEEKPPQKTEETQ
jgi:transposase